MRGSISIAMTFFAASSSFIVKLPVPGPISRTTSVDLTPALSTMLWRWPWPHASRLSPCLRYDGFCECAVGFDIVSALAVGQNPPPLGTITFSKTTKRYARLCPFWCRGVACHGPLAPAQVPSVMA
eukprot:1196030-Prorocentrum_minimum.AAC.4